jgi:hypothetical protein
MSMVRSLACAAAVAAVIGCGDLALGQAAPQSAPATPAAVKETGLTEAAAQEAMKKAISGIEFSAPATGDGRRRVFGTIAKAKLPTVELVGSPEDLSQVTAISPLSTPLGAAAIETSPFAVAVLEFGASDWTQRKDWLRDALKKVEDTRADYQVVEKRGRLQVSFAAWQRLGMFRVTIETVDGAAQRAIQTAKATVPGPEESKPTKPAEAQAAKVVGAAAKIETKSDGSLLVDGKYKIAGKGTEGEPYKLTWDQLVSAQDDYVPKDGRKEIPGRIAMLDGKWIEITGYVAFPLMADSSDELLSMLNQWDGCCIGIPPTPYDAIEVRLTKPVEGNARMATFGTVRGKFKVDPHLVGGWLVGLYAMDQAIMTPQTYGGFAP